eukprot:157406_1
MCMKEGKYTYIIEAERLEKMINAENGEEFRSKKFQMASFKWCIKILPNGHDEDSIGSFNICLEMRSFPKQGCIIAFTRIRCVQLNLCFSQIGKCGQYPSYLRIIDLPNYALSLNEIRNNNLTRITLSFEIKILRIINKLNEIIYEPVIAYDTN